MQRLHRSQRTGVYVLLQHRRSDRQKEQGSVHICPLDNSTGGQSPVVIAAILASNCPPFRHTPSKQAIAVVIADMRMRTGLLSILVSRARIIRSLGKVACLSCLVVSHLAQETVQHMSPYNSCKGQQVWLSLAKVAQQADCFN